jgi:hypothetical protein
MKLAKVLKQDQRTIERYIRYRSRIAASVFARFIMRRVLPFREIKKRRALASTIRTVAKSLSKHRDGMFETNRVLLNASLFFLLAEQDIQAMKIDALTHPDPWHRSLCARVILLTIHELDLDKVTGGKLRNALADAKISDADRREAAEALREVRRAQQRAQKEFNFLRNATIAHRDANAQLQYRAIRALDTKAVFNVAVDFYKALESFHRVLPRLLLQSATFPGLLSQASAYERRGGKFR